MSGSEDTSGPLLLPQLRRIFALGSPHRRMIALSVLLVLLSTLVQLALPLGIRELFDHILERGDHRLLSVFALLLLGLFLLRSVLTYFGSFLLQATGARIVRELRARLYEQYQALDVRFHTDQKVGDLSSRLSSDTASVRVVVADALVSVLIGIVQMLGASAVVLALNWRLGLVVLLVSPLTSVLSQIFGPHYRRASRDIQNSLAEANSVAQESLSAIQIVKAFARGPAELRRYQGAIDRLFRSSVNARRIDATFNSLLGLIASSSTIAIFWFGGLEVLGGRLTAGELVAFLLYSEQVSQATNLLAQHYSAFSSAAGASQRIFDILDLRPDIVDAPNALPLQPGPATVTFERVSFSYQPGKIVLRGVDLVARPGETLALVGPSGSGKSTLLKLLPRFYDPQNGRIQINGRDIHRLSLDSLRGQIAIVSQDVILFATTIRENIRYGRLGASDREVEDAARQANAHEFIVRLPDGYDTEIGEQGIRLSGGERQRISIARALLKRASILILDEATSAVDTASDALIREGIERLKAECTTFAIAHRLATVRTASMLAVLDHGTIVERGSHDELMARDGPYRQLVERQKIGTSPIESRNRGTVSS